jgi:hypothetical protein
MDSPAASATASLGTLNWWARFRQRRKSRALASQGFDIKLLRFPVVVTAILAALLPFDLHSAVTLAATIAFPIFALLVCAYFFHILMRRLQCSLLEFGLLIVVFGNAAGLVLTSSGIMALGWNWMLTLGLVLTAWILYGAVRGMCQARLLGLSAGPLRVLLMLAGWFTTAAPSLLFLGFALTLPAYYHESFARMIGHNLVRCGIPLLAAGLAGIAVEIVIHWKVRRAARRILNEV